MHSGTRACRAHDADQEACDGVGNERLVDSLLQDEEARLRDERSYVAEHVGRYASVRNLKHLDLVLLGPVVDHHLDEEAVELRLRQREDPLVLVGILRRDHDKRRRDPVRLPLHRDVALLHRLEQGGLRSRRRTVDLVREQDVREDDARFEPPLTSNSDDASDDLRRRRVRRELHALERHSEDARHRGGQERLGGARRPLEQNVAAGKGGNQHHLDRRRRG